MRLPSGWWWPISRARRSLFGTDHDRWGSGALAHLHAVAAAVDDPEVLEAAADEINIVHVDILERRVAEGAILEEGASHTSAGNMGFDKFPVFPWIIQTVSLFGKYEFSTEMLPTQDCIQIFHH